MKKNKKRIGILGGAFDPIHNGHIYLAQFCLEFYQLDQIRFIPSQQALLKPFCIAKPWQRAAMVALAINNYADFYLDSRELLRKQPSYALLTLQSLCQEFPDYEFFWILGEDAFANFTQWYEWQKIALLGNLLIVSRASSEEKKSQQNEEVENHFRNAQHEVIHLSMPLTFEASRNIRADLAQHKVDIPLAVWHFINENNLYLKK